MGGGSNSICWGYGDVPARQGVLFEDMCSLRAYFFPNFLCLCSLGYAFQPHTKLCVPSGYTISRFLAVFYVLSGLGSGPGDIKGICLGRGKGSDIKGICLGRGKGRNIKGICLGRGKWCDIRGKGSDIKGICLGRGKGCGIRGKGSDIEGICLGMGKGSDTKDICLGRSKGRSKVPPPTKVFPVLTQINLDILNWIHYLATSAWCFIILQRKQCNKYIILPIIPYLIIARTY